MQLLIDYLKKHDFDVTMGVGELKTAFVARYNKSTPGPKLGVILEYDALRGTKGAFHGDQHSTQGPIGIAAAVAVAEFLTRTKTPGSVDGVRRAGRGDDAAEREDRHVRGGCVQGHGRARAQSRRRARPVARRPDSARAA